MSIIHISTADIGLSSSDGHDSGLCAAPASVKAAFARDLLNLTLAAPKINRCGRNGKCGYDAGEWLPPRNKCWFAYRVVKVKQKYSLSVDRNEMQALNRVISQCDNFDMVIYNTQAKTKTQERNRSSQGSPLERYDDNGNGRITCAEARKHGIAPVSKSHPAYRYMHDGDGDGTVCE